jgi:hypothetical protein
METRTAQPLALHGNENGGDLDPAIATSVVYCVSRLVLDPERFTDDAMEPMAAQGMGAVYTSTTDSTPLRSRLAASERAELLVRFYEPQTQSQALGEAMRCCTARVSRYPQASLRTPRSVDVSPNRAHAELRAESWATQTGEWLGALQGGRLGDGR